MSIFCTEAYNSNMSRQNRQCIFQGIDTCRDHIGDHICNHHLGMFSLINKIVPYQNGDNDIWNKIVLYHSAPGNLNIPLFTTSDSKILMEDIRNFVRNVCQTYSNINIQAMESRIATYMGVSAVVTQANCRTGWLDDSNVRLIIRKQNGTPQYLSTVPFLHKVLFAHARASNTTNTASGSQMYRVPNVSLTANEMNNSFIFQVINKKNILRYTGMDDSVATPIVLDAFRTNSQNNDDIVIAPLINMHDQCFI